MSGVFLIGVFRMGGKPTKKRQLRAARGRPKGDAKTECFGIKKGGRNVKDVPPPPFFFSARREAAAFLSAFVFSFEAEILFFTFSTFKYGKALLKPPAHSYLPFR